MGLDMIDIMFRLEKAFDIQIPADEISAFACPLGEFHQYLLNKVRGIEQRLPVLGPLYNVVFKAIKKQSSLFPCVNNWNDLNKNFAPEKRAGVWQALESDLNISLPPLEHSPNEPHPNIPRSCNSVLSLARWIAAHESARVEWIEVGCERSGKMAEYNWSDDEVWDILRQCLIDALGVDGKQVTPQARFVEDLGME
jgi:acyl carrier protein